MSKTEEYRAKLNQARTTFAGTSPWKHYKGGVYMISGYTINSTTKEVDLLMYRVDGENFDPMNESDIVFSRPAKELGDSFRWCRVRKLIKEEWVPR